MSTTKELELIHGRDDVIIHGSTWAAIWHMSWPLVLNMATISVAYFADTWVAGQLGSDVQAAIGMGGQIWFFMIILVIALSAGTTALVSRFWGARDLEATIEAARQSLAFGFFFGLATAALGLICAPSLLKILGASARVQALGWDYLKLDLLSQFPYTLLWISNSIFRAKGNARVPMVIMALITFLVIVLDLVLCLGPPHLGISGIGLSWLIAGTIGVILSLSILRGSEIGSCLDIKLLLSRGLSGQWFVRLMKIGIPACVSDLSWVGGNFVFLLIFAHTQDPTSCQASWAIGLRCEEMIAAMPIYALSMAVAAIVGQNLGARQPQRAELAGWQVGGIGAALNTVAGLVMVLCAAPIAGLMSSDPQVIRYTVQFLQVVGLCEPFVAIWLILFGAMQGAGYTRWPMWATVACLAGFRIPIAWYLTITLGMGPVGAWLSLAICSVAIGLLAIWRFRTGVWKLHKV